jgi:hypothetical protein
MKKHLLSLLALAALTSATVAQVPSYVPSNGLVGWWPFNGNANDQSGNGNNGTVNGATLTTDRFGNANAAYDFDGVSDFIEVNYAQAPNFSNGITMQTWVRVDGTNTNYPCATENGDFCYQFFLSSASSFSDGHYRLSLNQAAMNLVSRVGNNGGVGVGASSSDEVVISSPEWIHFVATYDNAIMSLYINGLQQSQTIGSVQFAQSLATVMFGKSMNPVQYPYFTNGKLDDIGIWNRALTPCEVQQIYTATLPSISAIGSTTFCTGGSVTLTAQGTGSYLWSNGATSQSITATQGGNYSVTVTDNGCSTTTGVTTVTVNPTPTASITPQGNTTFCQGGFVVLQAAGGGTYQWNTGAQSSSINVSQGGTYTVVVSQNGCTAQAQQQVTVNTLPSVSLAPISALCANANAVQLSGGSPAGGSYTVNGTPATTLNPAQTGSGQQTVVYSYTDGNGCFNTATQSVTVNAVPSVSLSGLNTAYLPTDAPVQLSGSPAGGVFNGTGVSNGQFDPSAAGLGTHGVMYTVVDANGCVGGQALCTTVDLNTGSGIGLDNGGNGVEVYPNPSNGLFTVVMDGLNGIVQLSVMDIRGREVASQSLTATGRTTHNIDLSGFASGVYTLQIQSAAGVSGMKLVKE